MREDITLKPILKTSFAMYLRFEILKTRLSRGLRLDFQSCFNYFDEFCLKNIVNLVRSAKNVQNFVPLTQGI